MRLDQGLFDYAALRHSHEVTYRVGLIRDRLDHLNVPRDASALEIGLGPGVLTQMLVERFGYVTCVDIEPQRVQEVAAFIAPHVAQFICAAGETAVLPAMTFDSVFLVGLLEHCPDAVALLRNVRPALKQSGRVHVLVNNAGSIHRHLGVELGLIDAVETPSASDIAFGHYRVYTPESVIAEIEAVGLKVDYIDLHYLKPLPTPLMDRWPTMIKDAMVELGRKFPQFAAYTYLEAVLP